MPGAYRCAAYYGEDRFCFTALVRFAGTETVVPWRYDSAGYLDRPAQGPDGTIYATEHLGDARTEVLDQPDYGNNKSIVMLDGATGQVTGRVSFAPETRLTACGLTENEPLTIGPIVGADGNGYVAVRQRHRSYSGPCNDPPSQVLATDDEAWTLLRLSRTGELARAVVDECHMSCGSLISPQQLLPDGIGGLVVNGRRWLSQVQAYEQRVIQLDAEFARADFVVANATRIDLVGQAGTLFLQTKNGTNPNATTQAFDLPSGTTRWTATPGWPLVAAAPDGGAAAQTSTGELMQIDANGQFDGTISTTPLTDPVQIDNAWLGNGTANLKAVASNFVDGTSFNRTSVSVGVGLEEPRAYGSRLNQSGPPPGHATVQQAAVEMLRAYNGRSIYLDREFGGSICRNAQQRYIATFSQPDQPPNSDFVYSTGCERLLGIAGLELAGRYHTHGKFGSVGLSPYGDVINAQNNATTPWFVASPCGGIYEYSAYTTPRPWYRWLTSPSDLIPIYGKPLPQRATGRQPCPVDVGIPYPPQ